MKYKKGDRFIIRENPNVVLTAEFDSDISLVSNTERVYYKAAFEGSEYFAICSVDVEDTEQAKSVCTCNITQIMYKGCSCGGF